MRRLTASDPELSTLLGDSQSRFDRLVAAAEPKAQAFYQERLGEALSIEAAVARIVDDVAVRGDDAVVDYNERFDGASRPASELRVPQDQIEAAYHRIDGSLRAALITAAEQIQAYQQRLLPQGFGEDLSEKLGVRWLPLDRVAGYIPGGAGGSLPLCSSVLMNLIPAQVAGVPELVLVTPSRPDGSIADEVLAAAHVAGVHEIYRMGGVQAIAALACGTKTIGKVDKIVGPGNLFVTLAKRRVYGRVDLDMLAGPSEVLVLADGSVDPAWAAADLLSQAEHDTVAMPVLACIGNDQADAIIAQAERQLATLPVERKNVARTSWNDLGLCIICESRDELISVANQVAAEHLELLVKNPGELLPQIRHAGAIFVGPWSPEPIGDYIAGPSHTLPTGGSARMWSGIGADTFLRRSSIINYDQNEFNRLAEAAEALARAEGLEAHRRSIAIRRGETI